MAATIMTSLAQQVVSTATNLQQQQHAAATTTVAPVAIDNLQHSNLQSAPALQTITTAEGVSVILVPTTMVPANTAVTLQPFLTTATTPGSTDLQLTSTLPCTTPATSGAPALAAATVTPAPVPTALPCTVPSTTPASLSLKPLGVQMTTNAAVAMTTPSTTRTPPLKPPKKFRLEQEEQTRCKRRLDFASLGLHSLQRSAGAGGNRRNERERNRVKLINNTFVRLQQHLPQPGAASAKRCKRKLSKVDTLRRAIEYIQALQELLDDHDAVAAAFSAAAAGAPSPASPSAGSAGLASPVSASSGAPSPGLPSPAAPSLPSPGNLCPSSPEDEDVPDLHLSEQDLLDFASWFE